MINEAYLLLGSNLGDRQDYLLRARRALSCLAGNMLRASHLFETEAWGDTPDKQEYLNQAILLTTTHSPASLIRQTLRIEGSLGRQRGDNQYAARTIDIDIIFFNHMMLNTNSLVLPHPRMQLRRFVLEPLNEIAPDFVHPVFKQKVATLLSECDDCLAVKKLGAVDAEIGRTRTF
ncbi:MAG: 2-amino-4-hydroxy-6-hydroxymethyldihydropteridine diphosphokinase [Lentimicrobiaceae bacterium]|nr:2-amino-4-hydroxy-6-hydroxymethyldihydropteridine diphosphokinase [Lentimicrobiaceae bacterium]